MHRDGIWCWVVFIVVGCGVRWCGVFVSPNGETANAKGFGVRLYGVNNEIDGTSDEGVHGDECSRSVQGDA